MKAIKFLTMVLLLSINLLGGSETVTYTSGVIPTTYINSASVTTSSRATAPGLLTVTIPAGAVITSVNVAYNMTATALGYMAEQRSFIFCTSTGGTTEPLVYSGVGNSSGTYIYNRTNLTIANNVTGGGEINFELHAFRTYGGSGSGTEYNYVENSSWQVTVNYETAPDPPTNLTTTAYLYQIKLNWTKNTAENNVMIAYNTSNTFGTPTNNTIYTTGSSISGGGTVIYNGSSTSYYHSELNQNTQYYYKTWSVSGNNVYSSGITANAKTNSVPIVSNVLFVNNIGSTGKVDVYYDVTDEEQGTVSVSMEVSNDGGVTYNFLCTQVTGDVGSGISTGTAKHIVWDFAREHSGVSGDNFEIKIIADDNVGDQIYYAGKIYNTVIIGNQTWLKENLDVGVYVASIIGSNHSDVSNNGIIEKYCYGNNELNCATYGGLYDWNEAMGYSTTEGAQGICPAGWHLPTLAEYVTLYNTVGGDGNRLKAIGQGYGSGAGTNTSGFSALLGGDRGREGNFYALGGHAYLWCSTVRDVERARSPRVYDFYGDFRLDDGYKEEAFSIRCVKD